MDRDWLSVRPGISFLDLVRLLERPRQDETPTHSSAPDGIRFSVHAGLGHAPREVQRLHMPADPSDTMDVVVSFPGLTGVASPLPPNLLERLAQQPSTSLLPLLVRVFEHRLLAARYQIWRRQRRDAPAWERVIDALRGRRDLPLQGTPWLYAGSRSAAAVTAILRQSLSLSRIRLRQWLPVRLTFPVSDRCRLGMRNSQLGRSARVGAGMRVAGAGVRLELDDLDMTTWQRLLPGGEHYLLLRQLAARLLPGGHGLELALTPEDPAPAYRSLGAANARLGQSLWLGGGAGLGRRLRLTTPV